MKQNEQRELLIWVPCFSTSEDAPGYAYTLPAIQEFAPSNAFIVTEVFSRRSPEAIMNSFLSWEEYRWKRNMNMCLWNPDVMPAEAAFGHLLGTDSDFAFIPVRSVLQNREEKNKTEDKKLDEQKQPYKETFKAYGNDSENVEFGVIWIRANVSLKPVRRYIFGEKKTVTDVINNNMRMMNKRAEVIKPYALFVGRESKEL